MNGEDKAFIESRYQSLDDLLAWLDKDPRVEMYSRDDWALVFVVETPYFDMGSSYQPSIKKDLEKAFPNFFDNIFIQVQPFHTGSYNWRRVLRLYVKMKI